LVHEGENTLDNEFILTATTGEFIGTWAREEYFIELRALQVTAFSAGR
jgi:hypothetical protein